MASERFISWNVGNKSDALLLRFLLVLWRMYKPAAFVLQEVADRTAVLKQFAEESGYVLTQLAKKEHASSVVVLSRGDIPVGKTGGFRMTVRTFVGRRVAGSKDDGLTAPKWTTWAWLDFWGLQWVVASTHLTPSHQVAAVRVLVRLQVAAIALWMRTRRRIVLIGGDFNETVGSRYNLLAPLKRLASPFTAPSHGSRPIDIWWVVLKQLEKAGITVEVEALDPGPSDHNPMLLTLSRSDEHACPLCGDIHTIATP